MGLALVAGLAGSAHARTWTNHQGRKIEAEFVRLDGQNVVLQMNGKEVSVALVQLSDADKQFVFQQIAGASTSTPSAGSESAANEPLSSSSGDGDDDDDGPSSRGTREDDPSTGALRVRTWTDVQGNKIRAKFVRIHEGNVVLKQGLKTVPCPIEKLSDDDQNYLRTLLEARGEGDLMPSAEQLAARKATPRDGGYGGEGASGGAGGYSGASAVASATPYTPSYTTETSGGSTSSGSGAAYGGTPYVPGAGSSYAGHSEGSMSSGASSSSGSGYGGYTPPYEVTAGSSGASGTPYTPSYASTTGSTYGEPSYGGHGESGSGSSGASSSGPTFTTPSLGPEVAYNPTPTFEPAVTQQLEYYCSGCGKSVPEHINDRCPHCGIMFAYVEQPDGSRKYNGIGWAGGGLGIFAVIVGVIIRVIIMAARRG